MPIARDPTVPSNPAPTVPSIPAPTVPSNPAPPHPFRFVVPPRLQQSASRAKLARSDTKDRRDFAAAAEAAAEALMAQMDNEIAAVDVAAESASPSRATQSHGSRSRGYSALPYAKPLECTRADCPSSGVAPTDAHALPCCSDAVRCDRLRVRRAAPTVLPRSLSSVSNDSTVDSLSRYTSAKLPSTKESLSPSALHTADAATDDATGDDAPASTAANTPPAPTAPVVKLHIAATAHTASLQLVTNAAPQREPNHMQLLDHRSANMEMEHDEHGPPTSAQLVVVHDALAREGALTLVQRGPLAHDEAGGRNGRMAELDAMVTALEACACSPHPTIRTSTAHPCTSTRLLPPRTLLACPTPPTHICPLHAGRRTFVSLRIWSLASDGPPPSAVLRPLPICHVAATTLICHVAATMLSPASRCL